jgi:uncharacterized membrane protein (DUF4010 family)
VYGFRRGVDKHQQADEAANPLQLRAAIQMAVLFQLVLYMVTAVRDKWGETGMIVSGAVLGLTDMDALVISMTRAAGTLDQIPNAAISTAVGTISNTVLKLGLIAVLGGGRLRKLAVLGLIAFAAVSALLLLFLR